MEKGLSRTEGSDVWWAYMRADANIAIIFYEYRCPEFKSPGPDQLFLITFSLY
ncbi:MAG: hypothetical protein HZR80_20295 [Candidatus Heimdallarchaeota archaeon]